MTTHYHTSLQAVRHRLMLCIALAVATEHVVWGVLVIGPKAQLTYRFCRKHLEHGMSTLRSPDDSIATASHSLGVS
jgi:hypothetical protein